MPDTPLSVLLSQTLVAYTIEFDDEAEQRVPRGTTDSAPLSAGLGPESGLNPISNASCA